MLTIKDVGTLTPGKYKDNPDFTKLCNYALSIGMDTDESFFCKETSSSKILTPEMLLRRANRAYKKYTGNEKSMANEEFIVGYLHQEYIPFETIEEKGKILAKKYNKNFPKENPATDRDGIAAILNLIIWKNNEKLSVLEKTSQYQKEKMKSNDDEAIPYFSVATPEEFEKYGIDIVIKENELAVPCIGLLVEEKESTLDEFTEPPKKKNQMAQDVLLQKQQQLALFQKDMPDVTVWLETYHLNGTSGFQLTPRKKLKTMQF